VLIKGSSAEKKASILEVTAGQLKALMISGTTIRKKKVIISPHGGARLLGNRRNLTTKENEKGGPNRSHAL